MPGKGPEGWRCPGINCTETFEQRESLTEHIKERHEGEYKHEEYPDL